MFKGSLVCQPEMKERREGLPAKFFSRARKGNTTEYFTGTDGALKIRTGLEEDYTGQEGIRGGN